MVTSPVGYLRLHGRNTAMWFAEEANAAARYDYRYTAEELQELVDAVEVISHQARDTYLITNNHFRGQAALNALELRSHLRRSPIPVPPCGQNLRICCASYSHQPHEGKYSRPVPR